MRLNSTFSLVAGAAFATLLSAGAANAVTVTGSSGGSFSQLGSANSCDDGNRCQLETTSNGSNTQVRWGYDVSCIFIFCSPNTSTGSTLTAVDRAISASVPPSANDVILSELRWFNDSTPDGQTPDTFSVNYNLSIVFTAPNAASDNETFNLLITNTPNPQGDSTAGLSLADLSNLTFNLNGVIVSDIHYVVVDGAGAGTSSLSCSGGTCTWFNQEENNSMLYIVADFAAVNVPEPATLALFGAGLFGLGLAGRRRRA